MIVETPTCPDDSWSWIKIEQNSSEPLCQKFWEINNGCHEMFRYCLNRIQEYSIWNTCSNLIAFNRLIGHKCPNFCYLRKIWRCQFYNSAKKFPVDSAFCAPYFDSISWKDATTHAHRCPEFWWQCPLVCLEMKTHSFLLFQNLNGKRCWKLWTLRARE